MLFMLLYYIVYVVVLYCLCCCIILFMLLSIIPPFLSSSPRGPYVPPLEGEVRRGLSLLLLRVIRLDSFGLYNHGGIASGE